MLCDCTKQFNYMKFIRKRHCKLKSGRTVELTIFRCNDCHGYVPTPGSIFAKFLSHGDINAVASLMLELKV